MTQKTIRVAPMRFAAGWRLLESGQLLDGQLIDSSHAPGEPEPLVVDVLRPLDLVGFTIEAHGCDLVGEDRGPVLRPRAAAKALLVVRLPYQHLAEQAIYEEAGLVPDPLHPDAVTIDLLTAGGSKQAVAPVPARPARASRLVFAVPVTESIAFSTAGLLAALQRLPMVLHPLAEEPGEALAMSPADGLLGPILHLPGGLVAVVTAQGVVVNKLPPGAVAPDESTGRGLSVLARDLLRVRRALASRTATVAPGVTLAPQPAPRGATRSVEVGRPSLAMASLFGRAGLVHAGPIGSPRPVRPVFSRPPADHETSIEAPFRLAISPASDGHWKHANEPVTAAGAAGRIELWHTRLYRPTEHGDGERPPEGLDNQRIVRAVWARDRERHPDWRLLGIPEDDGAAVPFEPFLTSLDGADRNMLVRQSTETIASGVQSKIAPRPIEARKLWLSSLGAWLDLHGVWDTRPYSDARLPSILSWDHVAPLGRDQFVRVVYPGSLFPCGHKTTVVKITERKMKSSSSSLAGLYQRNFLVIGEPIRTYSRDLRDFPFDEVRLEPLVTPNLDPHADQKPFVPFVGSRPLQFVLHCHDRDGSPVELTAPLVWVPDSFAGPMSDIEKLYKPYSVVAAAGQAVAFAPITKGGDTVAEAVSITFGGTYARGRSTPRMESAEVRLPAVEYLSAGNAVPITYAKVFLDHGFTGPANRGEVWAKVTTPPILRFGGPAGGGPAPPSSAVAGGFLQPSFPIAGLSRKSGTVGDVKGMSEGRFEPKDFLARAGISGKLFGFIPLDKVTVRVDPLDNLLKAPQLISLAVDRIEGLTADLDRLSHNVTDAVAEMSRAVTQAGTNAAKLAAAQQTLSLLNQHNLAVNQAIRDFLGKLQPLAKNAGSAGDVAAALAAARDALVGEVQALDGLAPTLSPAAGRMIRTLAKTLRDVLASADVFEDIFRSLNGLAQRGSEIRVHLDWKPELSSWPADEPILVIKGSGKDNLLLSLGARFGGVGPSELEVVAELRDFALRLFGAIHLMTIDFDRLSFHFGTSGKTDVKVQLHHIEFGDCLAFAQPLADLFPLDGFSDPPAVDTSPAALTIGYTLVIPNQQMGVFTLMNLALGADITMPFDGGAMTVGLALSSRERPFTVAVVCIGGGGWVVTRVAAEGIKLLELGIEAGACVAMDFGVASGSVTAMLGIYVRLEGKAASFTAYFRLGGEISVLGIGSASLDARIDLTYELDTGKLVGSASITLRVEAFGLTTSRTFACKRSFGTRASDPTFRQVLDVADDGTSPHWFAYCNAFAGA